MTLLRCLLQLCTGMKPVYVRSVILQERGLDQMLSPV